MEPQRVSCDLLIPVAWEPRASTPDAARSAAANAVLLRALATLEAPAVDDDLNVPHNKALERVEAKVDLSLVLLSALLGARAAPPAPRALKLSALQAEWLEDRAVAPGQEIDVLLYLSPRLPLPVRLPATVVEATAEAPGTRLRAAFAELDTETLEWLERTVFRYHRRAVQSRQAQRS